jgi:hypothetical protein
MNPATGLPEFENGDFLGNYEDMAPAEQQGFDNQVFSPDTVSQPIDMSNAFIYSSPADTMEPAQTQPQFEPAMTRSFAPQMAAMPNEFVGPQQVRDFKQEAIDQGAAPQRDMQDLVKSGAKQVLEGLKTPTGAALGQSALAALMARRGYKQARAMENELRQLGQAPRQVGQEQLGAGMRGELTPVQQQQIAAFQAQQRQALANMGQRSGTAQQQLGARTVEMQQRGAQDLINQGLKNIGISDKYLQQAILAGYQADSQVADALGEALKSAGNILAGTPSTEVARAVQTPATQVRKTPLTSPLGG